MAEPMKRKPKKNQDDSDSMSEEESDEHFAYIAGYTSGGAPFGTTWEEMAEMEKREAEYLGRTCPWRECGPGIRTRCHAQHCGGHLYDDLQVLTLKRELLAEPPLEVFPKVVVRQEIPGDVMEAFGIGR